MKIVQLFNEQRSIFGGETTAISNTVEVLRRHGHQVTLAVRSSREIGDNLFRKAHAALSGMYSFSAISEIGRIVEREQPDVIHAHGVYPMWSPSIFRACRSLKVPTVLHVHCHYLTCPNWYHLRGGKVCNLCLGGNEHWCVLKNCRNSYPESAAYALRSAVARKLGLFTKEVGSFIAVSHFLRQRLVDGGYPADRIRVIPNAVLNVPELQAPDPATRRYIGFCGRLSAEKGAQVLIEAARRTGLPVRIAGEGPMRAELQQAAPDSVTFLGYLRGDSLTEFYRGCRFVVVPSLSYEGLPLAAAEAMTHGLPAIGSRIGALPEVITENQTGLLFEPGNVNELASLMSRLWQHPELCQQFGNAASAAAKTHYSEDIYHERLLAAYRDAAAFCGRAKVPSHDVISCSVH